MIVKGFNYLFSISVQFSVLGEFCCDEEELFSLRAALGGSHDNEADDVLVSSPDRKSGKCLEDALLAVYQRNTGGGYSQ